MMFYCVVSSFYDSGKTKAYITTHTAPEEVNDLPENRMEERKDKDVYFDYFLDKEEAIRFCDEINF